MKEIEKIKTPGYYWVENLGWDGKLVHRIIDVVEISDDSEIGIKRGYWGEHSYPVGLYVVDRGSKFLNYLERYFDEWENLKIEKVPLPETFSKNE